MSSTGLEKTSARSNWGHFQLLVSWQTFAIALCVGCGSGAKSSATGYGDPGSAGSLYNAGSGQDAGNSGLAVTAGTCASLHCFGAFAGVSVSAGGSAAATPGVAGGTSRTESGGVSGVGGAVEAAGFGSGIEDAGGAIGTATDGTGGAGSIESGGAAGFGEWAGTSAISAIGGNSGAGGTDRIGPIGIAGASGSDGGEHPSSPIIGDVYFDKPSQSFKDPIQVGMSTSIAGAVVRYTTDGLLPTATSPLYSAPVALTATTQLRAQAFVDGKASGLVSTAIFIARTIDLVSDLPIVVLDGYAKGKPTDKEVFFDAAVMIWEPVNGVASMTSLPTLAARAGYHVRGQSSAAFPQTPYRVELRDNADQDLDYAVLGMPAESDWALLAPYYDRALIRNPFTFSLGKDMGLQAPNSRFAEIFISYDSPAIRAEDYQGIYWVTETIKNCKRRTNLKQLKVTDTELPAISGGYIFKFDELVAEEPKLVCTGSDPVVSAFESWLLGGSGKPNDGTCWKDLEVVDPDPLNDQQKTWLTQYVQQFHDSLHQTPLGDYTTYIDVPSFVDNLILNEVTYNVDAYVRSAYYYKDRNQKLKAGPLWDYNACLGGVGAQVAAPTSSRSTGWRYSGTRDVNNWYPKLTMDPAFLAQVRTRYLALRQTILSQAAIEQRLDGLTAQLKQAIVRDYAKWPVSSVITSTTGFWGGPTVPTWEGQVQVVHDFLIERLAWMDANLP